MLDGCRFCTFYPLERHRYQNLAPARQSLHWLGSQLKGCAVGSRTLLARARDAEAAGHWAGHWAGGKACRLLG